MRLLNTAKLVIVNAQSSLWAVARPEGVTMKHCAILIVVFLLGTISASAENVVESGKYEIHYSAFTTDVLTPPIANAYKITRSKNRALLNIAILEKGSDSELGKPIEAEVTAFAVNLTGQQKSISMRLQKEQDARYYIGVVPVANQETLDFTVMVQPAGQSEPIEVKFRQKFYTE